MNSSSSCKPSVSSLIVCTQHHDGRKMFIIIIKRFSKNCRWMGGRVLSVLDSSCILANSPKPDPAP